MRKLSANYIYPISSPPIKNGVVIVDDKGVILDVLSENHDINKEDIEYYEGIICPGFVNTHCHLELSHLKGKIKKKTGITGFVTELLQKRIEALDEDILQAIMDAENEMLQNGIVAVGDICNTNSTFKLKSRGNLKYYNFIEVLSLNPEYANQVFAKGMDLKNELLKTDKNALCSIVPHAPYTVSAQLLKMLSEEAKANNNFLSIHMQESEAENKFFIDKTGSIIDLYNHLNINIDFFQPTEKSSLQSVIENFSHEVKTLFVHNTFTTEEEVTLSLSKGKTQDLRLFHCFCPNANLYIENTIPNFDLFIKANAKITIGTDSLASNNQLSVFEELKTISKHAPHIELQTLLTWATKNGAEFLGFDNELGTIEKGKRPGLVWAKNVKDSLSEKSKEIKLI